MKELVRGCTYDRPSGDFAVWMTYPKELQEDWTQKPIKSNRLGGQRCYLSSLYNRKGIKMIVLKGRYTGNDVYGFLKGIREDLTRYINKKKLTASQK